MGREFPGRATVQRNIPKAKKAVKKAARAVSAGVSRLGNARVKEILPAAGWGLLDMASGGKHTKHQNQKLSDKVDDALGRPMRPKRAKRAGK